MDWRRTLATGGLATALLLPAGAAWPDTGILALSGETLHLALPNPLIAFGSGFLLRDLDRLSETPAGALDPEAATLARYAATSGDTLRLHFEPSYVPLPEPGVLTGLVFGGALMLALGRAASTSRPVPRQREG